MKCIILGQKNYFKKFKPSHFYGKFQDFLGEDDNFKWDNFEKINSYFKGLISKGRLFQKRLFWI